MKQVKLNTGVLGSKSHDCPVYTRAVIGLFWLAAILSMSLLGACASESYEDRFEARLMSQQRLQRAYIDAGGAPDEAKAMFPLPRYKTDEQRELERQAYWDEVATRSGAAADAFGAASRELATNPWLSPRNR